MQGYVKPRTANDCTHQPGMKAPLASSPAARAVMQANRGRDTAPEMALRRELHRRGHRYRVHAAPLAGLRCRPDIIFGPARVAVFVHGCFWHHCPVHATAPKANHSYWEQKLARNVARDQRNEKALTAAGWHVVVVWEHEGAKNAADRVEAALRSRRQTPASELDSSSSPR